MMKVPFINLKKQFELIESEILPVITTSLRNGQFIMGESVSNFEKKVSEYLGVDSLGCASGSDALLLALMASGVSIDDEVITTPFTFFATAGAISRLNAKPVFVDIDDRTFNIDVDKLEEKITNKTKAIIVVHIFGQSIDMDKIIELGKKYNLKIIEDACQSFGAEYKHKKVGTIGDFGCFSFFPTKNLGCAGDGGLITCKNREDYEFVKKIRLHGASRKYYHEFVGINSRLDAIQAEILNIKLNYVDKWNNKRIEIADKYSNELKSLVVVPLVADDTLHIFHQYAILSDTRDDLLKHLNDNGISAGVYYPKSLHLQECFNDLNYVGGDFPVSEKVCSQIVSLPVFAEMTDDEIDYVISVVKSYYK